MQPAKLPTLPLSPGITHVMVCASLAAGPARVPASIRSSPALTPSPHAVGRRDDGRTSGARMMLGGTRRESLQHSRTARLRPTFVKEPVMIVTTTPTVEGCPVTQYLRVIYGSLDRKSVV